MSKFKSLRRPAAIATAALPVLLAGCGSAHSGEQANAPVVNVTEKDFHISAPASVPAGAVTFKVHNAGPDDHEFIVARIDGPRLPLRTDGLTINEEVLQKAEVGELEPGSPGARRTLNVHLNPGRYVFFCNMYGHFMAGMHTEVVVQ